MQVKEMQADSEKDVKYEDISQHQKSILLYSVKQNKFIPTHKLKHQIKLDFLLENVFLVGFKVIPKS